MSSHISSVSLTAGMPGLEPRTVTLNAADMGRIARKLKGRRMASKLAMKLAVNVQSLQDLPEPEEVAAAAAEMFEQAVKTLQECGGKTQRVREWRSEE